LKTVRQLVGHCECYNVQLQHAFETASIRKLRGIVVERRALAGEHSLSGARPGADGSPLMWVNHPLQASRLGQLSLSSFQGR